MWTGEGKGCRDVASAGSSDGPAIVRSVTTSFFFCFVLVERYARYSNGMKAEKKDRVVAVGWFAAKTRREGMKRVKD